MQIGKTTKIVTAPERKIEKVSPERKERNIPVPDWPQPVKKPEKVEIK